jgi:hypothetical protein
LQRALPRLVACAAAGVALFLIVGVFAPWLLGSERSLARVGGVLYRELQRGEALNSRDETVRRCLAAKSRITEEVLAGRLSLLEAARAFRECHEAIRDGNESWAGVYRAPEDEEAVCRNVIAWARQRTGCDPRRQAAAVRRLEAELREFLHARVWAGLSSVLPGS